MSILNTLGFTMAAGVSKLGATRPLARLGMSAGAGAIYGGTLGRDPGQSWYGGAFTGALGGAALYGAARYGRAAYRGTRGMGAGMGFKDSAAAIGRGAGRAAYARARTDIRRMARSIGFGGKMTRPVNPVASTLKRTPAPIDFGTVTRGGGVPAPVVMASESTNQALLDRIRTTRSVLGMASGAPISTSRRAVKGRLESMRRRSLGIPE